MGEFLLVFQGICFVLRFQFQLHCFHGPSLLSPLRIQYSSSRNVETKTWVQSITCRLSKLQHLVLPLFLAPRYFTNFLLSSSMRMTPCLKEITSATVLCRVRQRAHDTGGQMWWETRVEKAADWRASGKREFLQTTCASVQITSRGSYLGLRNYLIWKKLLTLNFKLAPCKVQWLPWWFGS